ncbi:MAG TPA: hypothetical protein PL151_17880 [Phycisphaerae bacterium]|nr:hypothetical protein [Phycisphaerae bacterium]
MTDRPERVEFLLLDWHLQQLDAEQASRVEEAIAAFPDLAEKNERLAVVLALLDRCPAPPARPGLAEAVLAKVEAQTALYPFEKPASAVPGGSAHELSASPVLSLRELIAIAACVTLFVGIFVPGYYKAQNIAIRNRCLDNMRQIWAGAAEYAGANDGYLAHAGYVPGASWLPTRAPNVKRVSNTAYMYKLVSDGYIRDARVFICPASPNGRPMVTDDYRAFQDFAEPANNTYSFLFMNLPKPRRLEDMQTDSHGAMVLVGDRNPLTDPHYASKLNPYDENSCNSPTHGGAGQNVAYVTGHARWFTSPTVGVDRDNIYRAGKLARYQGTEAPVSATDTLLVP